MAYREAAGPEGAAREAEVARLRGELEALEERVRFLADVAASARARADAAVRAAETNVAVAEEQRRRALLLALQRAPDGPEADGLRTALRTERRARDLRLALSRARHGAEPELEPAEALDLPAAQAALARAREGRARTLGPALARAQGAEARLRAAETERDEIRDLLERTEAR